MTARSRGQIVVMEDNGDLILERRFRTPPGDAATQTIVIPSHQRKNLFDTLADVEDVRYIPRSLYFVDGDQNKEAMKVVADALAVGDYETAIITYLEFNWIKVREIYERNHEATRRDTKWTKVRFLGNTFDFSPITEASYVGKLTVKNNGRNKVRLVARAGVHRREDGYHLPAGGQVSFKSAELIYVVPDSVVDGVDLDVQIEVD